MLTDNTRSAARPVGSTSSGRRPGLRPAAIVLGVGLIALSGILVSARLVVPSRSTDPAALGRAVSAGPLPKTVPGLQERLHADPRDWQAWSALGSAYLEQARITGNPALYPKADGAFKRSLALHPGGNDLALAGQGALANARHRFAEGLKWAERARSVNPRNPTVFGVLGDSLLELGRYPEAFDTLQRMVDLAPGVASYARASYALELQGDLPGATKLFELALQSARSPSDAAFANYYLGELAWNRNDVDGAAAAFERAAKLDAAFVPPAAGLARLQWARGDVQGAVVRYQGVVNRYPVPQYVTELGDLYTVIGQPELAAQQYELLRAQQRLLEANGVNIDLELSLFAADHGIDLKRGLAAAEAEWGRRHSIFVADALAWQLHANHRDVEALRYADEALRLGTRNPLFFFHRGMIEKALGQADAARRDLEAAVAINPKFSILHAGTAARALGELRNAGGDAR